VKNNFGLVLINKIFLILPPMEVLSSVLAAPHR